MLRHVPGTRETSIGRRRAYHVETRPIIQNLGIHDIIPIPTRHREPLNSNCPNHHNITNTTTLPIRRQKKMILRPSTFRLSLPASRPFTLFPSSRAPTNRIFDPVRSPNDLHTLTLLNAADNRALITFWTASWCQTCQAIKPLLRKLIEEEKVGEGEGGLGYVEVMMDSVLIEDLPIRYRVCIFFSHWKGEGMKN